MGPNASRAGQVMLEHVELDGHPFTLLNGGPVFPQTEAVSFQVSCADQDEVDHYWNGLTANGGSESPCGWCEDPFGVSWQIIPRRFTELMQTPDPAVVARVSQAMFSMTKLVVADLETAAAG
ncbi:VOC family protein [Dermacoccus sp. BD5]|nr:VOC family protein [Dermacoccus nishinomiyaensis]